MYDEDLTSCLYSLNSVWQSAEEMLKTFLMLVKNWAFHRYTNCFIDFLLITTENVSKLGFLGGLIQGAIVIITLTRALEDMKRSPMSGLWHNLEEATLWVSNQFLIVKIILISL